MLITLTITWAIMYRLRTYRTLVTVRLLRCYSLRVSEKRGMPSKSWNYSDQESWKSLNGWAGGGVRQSPIDIETKYLVKNVSLVDLKLTNFDKALNGKWSN